MKFVHLYRDDPRVTFSELGRPFWLALCGVRITKPVDVKTWQADWKWCEDCQQVQDMKVRSGV